MAQPVSPINVSTEAALAATPSEYHTAVRTGFAAVGDSPPLAYSAMTSPCTLNAGAGDGASQVPTSDGGCWLAQFPAALDARWWGQSYPATLYVDGSTKGGDQGGANYCLQSAHKCQTIQQAINVWMSLSAKGQSATISVAAGIYDSSNFAAGTLSGFGSSALTNGSILKIVGAGSNLTIVRPTNAGGGCKQHFGDAFTFSNGLSALLDGMKIGSDCPGRSGLWIQNSAYVAPGRDVQFASTNGSMVHVEALGYLEVPTTSPFTIASSASATAAIAYGSGAIVNFDGGAINFNGDAAFSAAFISGNDTGTLQFLSGATVNLNGHAVTGPSYSLGGLAVLYNQAGITIPGSLPGTVNSGAGGGFYADNAVVRFGAVGSPIGTASAPSDATTNLLLYRNSATNYAGFMADTAGDICAVAGVTSPACLFNIMHDGGLVAPWTAPGGDRGAGTLNITGPYYDGGTAGVTCSGAPTSSFATKGGIVTHC
jgi:hypothetical protein